MREREIHELTAEIRKLKTIGKSFRDSASIFQDFLQGGEHSWTRRTPTQVGSPLSKNILNLIL